MTLSGWACYSRSPGTAWRPEGSNLPERQVGSAFKLSLWTWRTAPGHKGWSGAPAKARLPHEPNARASRQRFSSANQSAAYFGSGLLHPKRIIHAAPADGNTLPGDCNP
jgi:hypothetical protein